MEVITESADLVVNDVAGFSRQDLETKSCMVYVSFIIASGRAISERPILTH